MLISITLGGHTLQVLIWISSYDYCLWPGTPATGRGTSSLYPDAATKRGKEQKQNRVKICTVGLV